MLRANGQKAVVVIATDGESSDGNMAEAMKPLQVSQLILLILILSFLSVSIQIVTLFVCL